MAKTKQEKDAEKSYKDLIITYKKVFGLRIIHLGIERVDHPF